MRYIIFLVPIFLMGCSSMERRMAGKIGCHYDNIEILSTDSNLGFSDPVYKAQCGESRQYICSLNRKSDELSCARTASLKNYPLNLFGEADQSFDEFVEDLNEKAKTRKR